MEPKKKDDDANFLCVQDTTVKVDAIRVHDIPVFGDGGEIVQTIQVKCQHGSRTKVAKNIGLQFLKHDTFIVSTMDGRVLKPLKLHEGGDGGLKLAENETVANYDELSDEALFRRCHILPASEDVAEDTPREDMIAFIKMARKKSAPAAVPQVNAEVTAKMTGGELGGQLDAGSISKLVTDSPLLSQVNRSAAA